MHARSAEESEIDHLAKLWFDSWRDAHEALLPQELIRIRTLETFRERLRNCLADIRVIGPVGEPVGFYLLKDQELYQREERVAAR